MNGLLLIGAGIMTAVFAYSDADWYFESSKAKIWASLLGGRENARYALIVLGILIMIGGFFVK